MSRSIPITLAGKDYEMMFEPEDVEALENEMLMGYIFFFRIDNRLPIYLSFKQERAFVHRGLRTKDDRGDLHYAFPQNPTGAKMAGELVQEAMRKDSRSLITIWDTAQQAFNLDWFEPVKDEPAKDPVGKKVKVLSKNSPGTG